MLFLLVTKSLKVFSREVKGLSLWSGVTERPHCVCSHRPGRER